MRIRARHLVPALPLSALGVALLLLSGTADFVAAQAPPTPAATPRPTGTLPGVSAPARSATPAGGAAPTAAGSVEITQDANGKTFHVAVGQNVVVRLGTELDWTVSVAPPGILLPAAGVNTLVRGVQAILRASQPGTATVSAEGRPHCNPGRACAQFIVSVKATVIVDANVAAGRPAATQNPVTPGAAATRPPAVAALPNTGTGPRRAGGPAWVVMALGGLLVSGALWGAGVIAWRARRPGSR